MQAHRFLAPLAIAAACAAATPEQLEYFEKNVRPLLVANCQPCHNAKVKSSGLDLSTAEGFMAGGNGGPLIARDQPEKSHILTAVGYEESLKMPPTGKLKAEQIEVLTNWVKMGAPWPGASMTAAVVKPSAAREWSPEQKAFWAFQPLSHPAVPAVHDAKWASNEIDRFILAKLEAKNITPAAPADKLALLRRVTFDLTGLPPTKEEIASFLADASPKAYEKVVDRLLASPRYGERWARHWLDVARYADSTGNDEDHRYPHAWRYRDYVIDAFNRDVPYDQFVREQIAGDLMPAPGGAEVNVRGVVATGFLALGAKALAQVDKKKMLYDVWDEQVDVTSKAFLGVTLACARCHDHKFDPLSTRDYYSMVGVFASTRSFEKPNQGVASLFVRPLIPAADYKAWQMSEAKIGLRNLEIEEMEEAEILKLSHERAKTAAEYMLAVRRGTPGDLPRDVYAKWAKVLEPPTDPNIRQLRSHLVEWWDAPADKLPELAQAYALRLEKGLDEYAQALAKRHDLTRKKLDAGEPATEKPLMETKDGFFNEIYSKNGPWMVPPVQREKVCSVEVQAQIAKIKGGIAEMRKAGPPQPDMADAVSEDTPVQQKVLLRGDYNNPGEDAPRAVPAVLTVAEPQPSSFHGSGRLELANWIADARNPLTARVMVNRVWMWHFGEGIVATPDNFGKMGARPTHPELLDYLSNAFVESGWSVKKLQKMILLSSAYRTSTEPTKGAAEADPENLLLSHFNRQRLDVEEVRDAMLAIDGSLDLTMGGTLQTGTGTDGENSAGRLSLNPETVKRRTVYLPLRRSNLPTLLNLFDFGDATTVNGKRALTNVAPQALFMMNSEFVFARADAVTQTLSGDGKARLEDLYLRILDRKPSGEEVDAALTYMERYKQKFHADDAAAWRSFCHVLFASNEFLYLD